MRKPSKSRFNDCLERFRETDKLIWLPAKNPAKKSLAGFLLWLRASFSRREKQENHQHSWWLTRL
ncbi:hypothetical protein GJS32_06350 [Streptococcus equi subsp. zooepidemicus]|nr:hypothetical protein GJS32_06350 [Streptococcus equi subsp. zooepidemicus]QGM20000.1 hypothetical protein GJS34_06350 [Streptococcus equi subsp. zooepidemicus]